MFGRRRPVCCGLLQVNPKQTGSAEDLTRSSCNTQVEIINKDVIANPITGEGPEAAGKKTLAAAEKLEQDGGTYASRAFANFAKWRSGEATDETRRFDVQQASVVQAPMAWCNGGGGACARRRSGQVL